MEGDFFGEMYGDPAAAEHYFEPQTQPLDCVEMSAADIIGQETGHEPTESQITTVAEDIPSTVNVDSATGQPDPAYDPATGTALQDAPELLAHYHVSASYVDDTTATASGAPGTGMQVLEQDLANGDKIIAGVDGPQIWDAIGDGPVTDPGHADHAVVVTGVDTSKGVVYLNDSGVPNGAEEAVPIQVFENAWGTSGDAMVVAQPGSDHSDTTVTSDTTTSAGNPGMPADTTLVNPTPNLHDVAEKASITGTVASAGATAAYWAYRRRTRRATTPRPRLPKPPTT